jgi:predicted metal-dependent hydrolase
MDTPAASAEIDSALAAWAHCLNAGEYFEAHEALEGVWLTATEPDRTFLKGLIHIAVVLRHHERGNQHGTRVKHESAVRYLTPYLPAYRGVALAELLAELADYVAMPVGARTPPQVR